MTSAKRDLSVSHMASTIESIGSLRRGSQDNDMPDEPLNVDIMLAMLEANKPADQLRLGTNPTILKMLETQQAIEGPESVVLSELVTKFNRKKKAQERVLMVTQLAVYNLVHGKWNNVQRRIPIQTLSGLTLSKVTDEFVLHVKDDYDYHYKTPRRADIVHCIALRYQTIMGEELQAQVADDVTSAVMTKVQMQKQTAASKASTHAAPSIFTQKIRALVSKKKIRWQKDGYDLDLTYITGRIIAMGFPSEDLEGLYRNAYQEVYRFFESRHKGCYRIYNLCSERKYEASKFHNRVRCFPFDDHNPPPLRSMVDFCTDAAEFLDEASDNVIAVHCKAGKGRTGVMLAAYMVWSGLFPSATNALTFFGNERTHDGKGVTIPSQRRFVSYFERLLREYIGPERPFDYSGSSLILRRVRLSHVPVHSDHGCALYFKVFSMQREGALVYDSRASNPAKSVPLGQGPIELQCEAPLQGEVKFVFYDAGSHAGATKQKIFHFWLQTTFVGDYTCLPKGELDKARKDKKNKKFPSDFQVEVWFDHDEYIMQQEPSQLNKENQEKFSKTNAVEIVKRMNDLANENKNKNHTLERASARINELEKELEHMRNSTQESI